MILGIQLIGIIFGVFMMYYTFLNYKQNKFIKGEWIIWSLLWVGFLLIILFPGILNPILEILNLYRAMDLYISLGFLFFILLIFHLYSATRSNQQKLEVLVREVAYGNVRLPKPRKRLRR